MENGYNLLWSERSLADIQDIISYLLENWSEKEVSAFVKKLDKRVKIIVCNPRLFPQTKLKKQVRRSVLSKQITLYYFIKEDSVIIITLFNNRQNPKKLIV